MTMDSDIVAFLCNEDVEEFLQTMKEHDFSVSASSAPKIAARLKRSLPLKLRLHKRYSIDVRRASYSLDYHAIKGAKRQMLFEEHLTR